MNNLFNEFNIKQHWYIPVGFIVIIGLIVSIFLVMNGGTNKSDDDTTSTSIENKDNEPTQVVEQNKIINESLDLSKLDDTELREELVDKILLGNNAIYNISDRYFAVLTTGMKSNYKIEYETSMDSEGNTLINGYLSQDKEDNAKIRYKIIELENNNARIVQSNLNISIEEESNSGLCPVIIYNTSEGAQYINTIDKTSKQYDGLLMPGIYMAVIKDEKISSTKPLESCSMKDCKAGTKVSGSGSMYNMYLSDNTLIQVSTKDELIEGTLYDVELTYNNVSGILSVKTK